MKTLDSEFGGISIQLDSNVNGTAEKQYIVDSNEATIIVDFNLALMALDDRIQTMPLITYEQVGDDHCSHICKNGQCLQDNYQCDGNPGCPDEADEVDCIRAVTIEQDDEVFDVVQIKQETGNWRVLCSTDEFDRNMANLACYQLGYWAAASLNYKQLTSSKPNYKFSTPSMDKSQSTFIQGQVEVGVCPDKRVWVLDCAHYSCGKRQVAQRPQLRIVGGAKTYAGKWPWVASLQMRNIHNCGGTLISDRLVITAAHCFDNHAPKQHVILMGNNNLLNPSLVRRGVKLAHIHPEYYPDANIPYNDIAIIQLDRKVEFSEYLQPVCLPTLKKIHGPGSLCYLAGWGKLAKDHVDGFPSIMHDVASPIIPNDKCGIGEYSRTDFARDGSPISSRQICSGKMDTGGVGICHGDSGGPLMCEDDDTFYLTGIVSWSSGCAEKNAPDVLTRVDRYLDWIAEASALHIDDNTPEEEPLKSFECYRYNPKTSVQSKTVKKGIVQSYQWPKEYPVNINCTVSISILTASSIIIEPRYFALPQQSDRSKVVLYDGEIKPDRILGEFYGIQHFDDSAMKDTIRHHGPNDLIVEFISGPNKQWHGWGGFQLYFELSDEIDPDHYVPVSGATCGGTLVERNLYFEWPFSQDKCLWNIPAAPAGKENKIIFTEFDVDDRMGIFNLWRDKIVPNNQIEFSDTNFPIEYVSTSAFIIEFTGLDKTIDGFFRLEWDVVDVVALPDPEKVRGSCTGNFTTSQGYIASPNWPKFYPSDSKCAWFIGAKPEEIVEIQFLILDVEQSYDYVDIIEMQTMKTVYVNIDESVELNPDALPITTVGPTKIEFTSDDDVNERGFLISYSVTNPNTVNIPTTDDYSTTSYSTLTTATPSSDSLLPDYNATCEFTTLEQNGVLILKSPGYPNGYPVDADCKWELSITNDEIMIELEMLAFHVEESNECQFDALEISDGTVGLGMSLCGELGQDVPRLYQMRNDYVKLHFHSDEVHGYEGFEIKVTLKTRPPSTPTPAHVLFQCDFDFDICGFHHGKGSTIEWIRMRDATPSDGTGPPYDVSLTGYYMYFEASDRNEGDLGRLFTSMINYEGNADNSNLDLDPHCFQFYFDMHGEDMGSLRLYLVHDSESGGSDRVLLWEVSGEKRRSNEEQPWKQVIDKYSCTFSNIYFIGITDFLSL